MGVFAGFRRSDPGSRLQQLTATRMRGVGAGYAYSRIVNVLSNPGRETPGAWATRSPVLGLRGHRCLGYAAIVAATIALIQLVDMLRDGSLDFSVRLVLLVVGVILALISSLGHRKG